MKKPLIAILAVLASAAQASGIPVVDAASLQQAVQTTLQLQMQYQQLLREYDQHVKAYRAATGTRSLGLALWETELRSIVPEGYREAVDAVLARGAGGLTGRAAALYRESGLGRRCEPLASGARELCEREAAAAVQTRVFFEQAAETAGKRTAKIEGLLAAINSATDPKAIADLQARIAGEAAALASEKLRMEAIREASAETGRILALQQERETAGRFAVPAGWKRYLE